MFKILLEKFFEEN